MRRSYRYYAKRNYRQAQANKAYRAEMARKQQRRATTQRLARARQKQRQAQRAEWAKWHEDNPGQRWAPGERETRARERNAIIVGLAIALVIIGGIVGCSVAIYANTHHNPTPGVCPPGGHDSN